MRFWGSIQLAHIDGFALCGQWTISQDRLPGLPIISLENIRARYLNLSNIVKLFKEKRVNSKKSS